jgi:hypothetical protein
MILMLFTKWLCDLMSGRNMHDELVSYIEHRQPTSIADIEIYTRQYFR